MMLSILGFFLLLLPFSVLSSSANKLRDFVCVFVGSALFYLGVAVVTEFFHIFTYGVVLVIHILFLAIFIWWAHKRGLIAKKNLFKFDKYLVVLCLFAFMFLSSLHFFYTGPVDSLSGLRYVKTSTYQYPFYSDEWVAVGLVDHTIDSHSLPFVNPLFENRSFPNYLFAFDSLLAYLFLILNISVLNYYVWFAILNTVFISILIYLFLKSLGISRFASFIPTLTLLFVTNSGNLPGLWNLLPYNVSLDFLIIGMIGLVMANPSLWSVSFGLSIIIYPPILVFILPLTLGVLFNKDVSWYKKINRKTVWVTIILGGIALFFCKFFNILDLIVRSKLDKGTVYYEPWNILPFIIIPFVLVGVVRVIRERNFMLLFPIAVGIFFWIFYIFAPFVFMIEQNRVVVITSVFLVLVSAYGIDSVINLCTKKFKDIFDKQSLIFLKVIFFIFYLCMAIFNNHFGMWHKLIFNADIPGGRQFIPAPPVTRYLTSDDLRLFKDIKGQRFIAPSWKGLVVGVATGNFPLDSKTSTISNVFIRYDDFVRADCKSKKSLVKKFNISYAYMASTTCEGFSEVGKSSEGLVLYQLN